MSSAWQVVAKVSTWFTLAAFITAAVVACFRVMTAHQTKWFKEISTKDKLPALYTFFTRFEVKTDELSKAQKFIVILTQVFMLLRWPLLFAFLGFLGALLWFVSIRKLPAPITLNGSVIYEATTGDQRISPVPDAYVEIEGTGLHATTNARGEFSIQLSPGPIIHEIIITRAGHSYLRKVNQFPDNTFRIPHEGEVQKSKEQNILEDDWTTVPNARCAAPGTGKDLKTAQFSLSKNVQSESNYSDVVLRVWTKADIDIVSAHKQEPLDGLKVQDNDGYKKAQKWQVPMKNDITHWKILVCLGTVAKGVVLSRNSVHATYWFEKVE